ncbi:MAG: hypothetical protein AAGF95_25465 [Chloroflexota bacterium]
MSRRLNLPCDALRTAYESGQTTTEIAQTYECCPTTIANHLRRCGVILRTTRFRSIVLPKTTLQRLYQRKQLPLKDIADYFGVSISTVGNKRRLYGIPSRTRR